jgi:hypothetical protein
LRAAGLEGSTVYLVLLDELVGRHLRTNPLDKYGVLLDVLLGVEELVEAICF